MATLEQLKLARKKALQSPRIGKRGKNKETITKEKAREAFELAQLKKWEKISDAQAKDAVKNFRAREYTLNQVIGKPQETIEHKGSLKLLIDDV
jgi:predicted transcriptional regulator